MTWYLRKSVKVGPIRFNLSKSGIGTSVGVTGFRVGVRPNGSSYLHAGRHGIYYREELGNIKNSKLEVIDKRILNEQIDLEKYDSISSSELVNSSRKELVSKLSKSYNSFRFDYLSATISFLIILFFWKEGLTIRIISSIVGVILTGYLIFWEIKRRTINITYDFEDGKTSQYEKIIKAFNNLANNSKIWSMIDSRNLFDSHESKLNAGASNLINRTLIKVGKGTPPWVKTNISIPLIKTNIRSLYFMPDGILIYDNKGIGFVDYQEVTTSYDTTRFIEENPPCDSKTIDYTWKYPNKNGGPDGRFNNNYQIPICLYGELKLETTVGLLLYIQTSVYDSPEKFYHDFSE